MQTEAGTAFYDVCYHGDLERIAKAIAAGQDVNAHCPKWKSMYQPTALAYAVWGQQVEAVRLLLESGANPDLPDGDSNYYPLHWASYKSDNGESAACAQLLVDAGADVNVMTARGFTPLDLARGLNDLVSSKPGVVRMPAPRGRLTLSQ